MATADFGLGRAHEEVRGFLPAVVVGVQDRHVPIDFRIVEPRAQALEVGGPLPIDGVPTPSTQTLKLRDLRC